VKNSSALEGKTRIALGTWLWPGTARRRAATASAAYSSDTGVKKPAKTVKKPG